MKKVFFIITTSSDDEEALVAGLLIARNDTAYNPPTSAQNLTPHRYISVAKQNTMLTSPTFEMTVYEVPSAP